MASSLDLDSGTFGGEHSHSIRHLSELKSIFQSPEADGNDSNKVYEIFGSPGEIEGPPQLLRATTILYPGQVRGEYFMTRGHFHTDPARGEFMLTLSGEGLLVLMDRERHCQTESMTRGSVHDIDGKDAHRVVNVGEIPLVFLVVWMSDCGHDYEAIRERGFGVRIFLGPDGPKIEPE